GGRTREIVGTFKPQDWEGSTSAEGVERVAAEGAFGIRREMLAKAFTGRPRAALLSGIALFHAAGHMGEANTVRTAGGFGSGVSNPALSAQPTPGVLFALGRSRDRQTDPPPHYPKVTV